MKMRYLVVACLLFSFCNLNAEPTLIVDKGLITWKDVFDAGMKPKRLQGLESKSVSYRNSFRVSCVTGEGQIKLAEGRTKFSFIRGGRLQLLSHTENKSISRDEVIQKALDFQQVFQGHITTQFTPPDEVYDRTSPRYSTPEYTVSALVGRHRYSLSFRHINGFEESFTPHFIFCANNGENYKPKDVTFATVQPPEGYEDYDIVNGEAEVELDKSIALESTGDEGEQIGAALGNQNQKAIDSSFDTDREKISWIWFLLAALVVVAFGGYLLKKHNS